MSNAALAAPATVKQLRYEPALQLSQISESGQNPRKTFDKVKDKELEESIRQHGIMQAIRVRPLDKLDVGFEIVFGTRRVRAAKKAGLKTIKAEIVELTDAEALEEMIVENAQREDVPPLEEAEGYRVLHEVHHYSVDEIVAKTGKPKSTIYERLKLTALTPAARKIVLEHGLSLGTTLLVARIPVPELQVEAAGKIAMGGWGDSGQQAMSAVQAQRFVRDRYMLKLADAPFKTDDADLVAKAGACVGCPKRTGNQPQLFPDVDSPDVCTDPDCFTEKKNAHYGRQEAEAKAKGQKILSGAEVKKLFPYGHDQIAHDSAFVRLEDRCQQDPKDRTFRKLLGKKAPETILARAPSGALVEVVTRKAVGEALKEAGHDFTTSAARRSSSGNESWKKQEEKKKRDAAVKQAAADRALEQIVAAAAKGGDKAVHLVWRVVAAHLVRQCGPSNDRIATRLGYQGKKAFDFLLDHLDDAPAADLKLLALEMAATSRIDQWRPQFGEQLEYAAEMFDVDLRKLEADAKAAAKAEEKAKAKPAKKKGGKKK